MLSKSFTSHALNAGIRSKYNLFSTQILVFICFALVFLSCSLDGLLISDINLFEFAYFLKYFFKQNAGGVVFGCCYSHRKSGC